MTSLKNQLTLELLKRKSNRKGLNQGFTLVELMIVIVIVGVLSAVALPSFLGQQNKAKITEASSKLGAILKSAHAEYVYDNSTTNAQQGATDASTDASTGGKFTYAFDAVDANTKILYVKATPKAANAGGDSALVDAQTTAGAGSAIYGCVGLSTGKVAIDRQFRTAADKATVADCS